MHKIISVTDRNGNPKVEFINQIKIEHPNLIGNIICYDFMISRLSDGLDTCLQFVWDNNSGKMMRTSRVESVSKYDNKIKVVTRNSIYLFEEVE